MTADDSSGRAFWDTRYEAGTIPWDIGGIPPHLHRAMPALGPPGRVLIPGCGSGHEVRAFVAEGWDVTAIDFSEAAVAHAHRILGPLARHVRRADFFADEFGTGFDIIYERTFLCAFSPARWADYAARVHALLKPHGRLAGFFYYDHNPEPPPYGISSDVAAQIFGGRFTCVDDVAIPATDSLPLHAGHERWQVWQRI